MHFAFSADQRLFADGLRDLLAKECTPAHVRAVWDDGRGHDPALWMRLAELGVFGMLVPETDGGLGGDEVDLVLLLEELGRAAAPGPVLETAAVAAPVLGAAGLGAAIADGSLVASAQLDGSPYVPHAGVADVVLVPGGLVRAEVVDHVAVESLDRGRLLAERVAGAVEPFEYDEGLARDRGAMAAAAFLVGLADRMVEMAAQYARERVQYGRPIGTYQAVKHLLADALLKIEFAKPAVYRAAWSIAETESTRGRDVSMAKALASEAAYRASRSAMQVHGAIGYTWEHDLQLFMKKAWALQRAWGSATHHRRRVAAAVL